MARVLVTGANGFIGRALVPRLIADGHDVVAWVRRDDATSPVDARAKIVEGGDIATAAWEGALQGVEVVVHLAGRVHKLHETAKDAEDAYTRPNVVATRRLAEACRAARVRRFVFVSSVKAVGEGGELPYNRKSPLAPQDPYGRSKRDAESAILSVGIEETLIVRPPVVYGPGVGANILRLVKAVDHGLPIPVASVRNARSLVFVGNLADSVAALVCAPPGTRGTYYVSDGPPLSTPDLVRAIGVALGRRPRLWSVPPGLLRALARGLGRRPDVDRLVGSLVVDDSDLRRELGWNPPYTLADGLARTVETYRGRPPR